MADIFGRQDQVLRGGLSSDAMFVTFPGAIFADSGVGMLIQNMSVDYTQPIRRIFEIGPGLVPGLGLGGYVPATDCDTPNPPTRCNDRAQPTYFIIGRPEGRLQMGRLVGPQVFNMCFIRLYSRPCSPNIMMFTGSAGCVVGGPDAPPRMTWELNGVVINQYGTNMTAQEMVIQENLSAMFAGLSVKVNGQVLPC